MLRDDVFLGRSVLLSFGDGWDAGSLVPLGVEVNTGAGFLDLLSVDLRGRLYLTECKLGSSPEAKTIWARQLFGHAAMLRTLSPDDLRALVVRLLNRHDLSLSKLARSSYPDFDEDEFFEAIWRNDFGMLLVGDAIRPEARELIAQLQDKGHMIDAVAVRSGQHSSISVGSSIEVSPLACARTKRAGVRPSRSAGDLSSRRSPAWHSATCGREINAGDCHVLHDPKGFASALERICPADPSKPVPHHASFDERRLPLPLGSEICVHSSSVRGQNRIGVTFRSKSRQFLRSLDACLGELFKQLPCGTSWKGDGYSCTLVVGYLGDASTWTMQKEFLRRTITTYAEVFGERLAAFASTSRERGHAA